MVSMLRAAVPAVSAPASSSIIKMSRCNGESFKRRGIGIFLAAHRKVTVENDYTQNPQRGCRSAGQDATMNFRLAMNSRTEHGQLPRVRRDGRSPVRSIPLYFL